MNRTTSTKVVNTESIVNRYLSLLRDANSAYHFNLSNKDNQNVVSAAIILTRAALLADSVYFKDEDARKHASDRAAQIVARRTTDLYNQAEIYDAAEMQIKIALGCAKFDGRGRYSRVYAEVAVELGMENFNRCVDKNNYVDASLSLNMSQSAVAFFMLGEKQQQTVRQAREKYERVMLRKRATG